MRGTTSFAECFPGFKPLFIIIKIIVLFKETGGYEDGIQVYQRKEFEVLAS